MKKLSLSLFFTAACLPLLLLLTGCLKDSCSNTYTIATPIFQRLSAVRAGMGSGPAQPLEQTGKLYLYGAYIFLNEKNKGIHVIDNSQPSAPRNIAFINIPGNVDMAVRGNYLYADCYSDVVVLDIAQPQQVKTVSFLNNALPANYNFWGQNTQPDSVMIPVSYWVRDTTVDCDTWTRWNSCANCMFADAGGRPTMSAEALSPGQTGRGGSMARFTIAAEHLYGVTGSSLHAFSLADPSKPQATNTVNMGWGIETIYPFQDKLFIGSNTGMFIYNIAQPSTPVLQGRFAHAFSCDPVIADDTHAYVTLRSGTNCRGANVNQLDVLDITQLSSPTLLRSYQQSHPHGLSKDGNLLFLCDGAAGLKVFDATQPSDLKLLKTFGGMEAYDVVAGNGLAIVVAKDGLYQYSYNGNLITLLSKINLTK